MRWVILMILIIATGCSKSHLIHSINEGEVKLLQAKKIQLSNPRIMIDSLLFRENTKVNLQFDLADSEMYYKLDNSDIQLYEKPFIINESTNIKVQARKQGFISSDWLEVTSIKINDKIEDANIHVSPNASETYPGNGANTLIDLEKGKLDFKVNQSWLGFQFEEVIVKINFQREIEIDKIFVSLLEDNRSWIFLPEKIQILDKGKIIGTSELNPPLKAGNPTFKIIPISIPEKEYENIEIRIFNLKGIPNWHAGKGSAPWLFIDEVFIN